jgi:predicted ABC-type ATPase
VNGENLYIIAGCNGAGKTTACYTILPEIINCKEYINSDEIARGLSPFQPEKMAITAGKLMIKRIDDLLKSDISFAFETTLASKTYKNKIHTAKERGYKITLFFFWLQSIALAKERVRVRVKEGGHDVSNVDIERRYKRGIENLFNIYLPLVDNAYIFDNSGKLPELVAEKLDIGKIMIHEQTKFDCMQFLNYRD